MFRLAFLVMIAIAPASRASADAPLQVVATFSILGDLVKNVGGDRVLVETLVGPNGDAHGYTPKPTDAKKISAAKLIFINGLDFERWMDRLFDTAATKARAVSVSRNVSARLQADGNAPDPHAWQAVGNVAIYVRNIRDALIEADPASSDAYSANATSYTAQLDKLDREIRETVARIPKDRRRAVTPHPSFGYFADAYGLQFSSPRQLGGEAETSARTVASIVDEIRRDHVAAIFGESSRDPRLMQQIASETGVKLGRALYSDALTDIDGPASSYIAMMQHNLHAIETALRN